MSSPNLPAVPAARMAEVILGGQDGMVNVLGLVLGLAAAAAPPHLIVVGGLAATFAESISMAAVVYTSRMAEQNQYEAQRRRQLALIRDHPDAAREELRTLFQVKGFDPEILAAVVNQFSQDQRLWTDTLMSEGSNLRPTTRSEIMQRSLVTGISTVIGSLVPLLPFIWISRVRTAALLAVAICGVVLFGVGAYGAHITIGRPARGGLQMLLIGLGAALAGYLIGTIIK